MTWYPITARQNAENNKKNRDFYLKWNPGTLADSVNRMFSPKYNDTWGQFASTKWTKEGYGNSMNGFLSLEYIHNNVHVRINYSSPYHLATDFSRTSLAVLTTRPAWDT